MCLTVQKSQQYEKKEVSECLESTAERRARRNRDIKALFQQLTVEEGFSFMDAYEVVGYRFYESADHIRRILRTMNKSGHFAHNRSAKKQYLCTRFRPHSIDHTP